MATETAVKQYLEYLNKPKEDKKELFDVTKKGSIQFSLNKIPNLQNDKRILCKLPHSLNSSDNELNICLIVKDVDPKDRDFEKTIRKYKQIIEKANLSSLITQIIPIKQLKLEFRHFEAKRKLCTSFDMFLSDKCLHEILFNGSKLGKEFKKRKRMPVEIDMDAPNLKESIDNILHSTYINITGKGPIIDVHAFLSTHTVEQACKNISAIKSELIKNLPGGEDNIKSIYIKSTDEIAVPIYVSEQKDIKVANNMTPVKIKKAKKLSGKRLKRKKLLEAKKLKREMKAKLAASERDLMVDSKETAVPVVVKVVAEKKKVIADKKKDSDAVPKVADKTIKKPAKAKATKAKAVKIIK